jgi:hypothetical protein
MRSCHRSKDARSLLSKKKESNGAEETPLVLEMVVEEVAMLGSPP